MKKRNFIPWVALVAVAMTMVVMGHVYAWDDYNKCLRPGTSCYQATWEGSSDPTFPSAFLGVPGSAGLWVVTQTPAGDGSLLANSFDASDPVTGVPSYCNGRIVANGTQVVGTHNCQEGSIATEGYTNTWGLQITFVCKDGELVELGTWSSIYTYAFPFGDPFVTPQIKPGLYGPFYGYGTITMVPCDKD